MRIREYKGTEEFLLKRREKRETVWIFDVFKHHEIEQHLAEGWKIVGRHE